MTRLGGARELAWVLNLDAEEELRDPDGYRRSARMGAHLRRFAEHLGQLVRPGDLVLDGGADAQGRGGRAWCPTPSAVRALAEAGAVVTGVPGLQVLRRVNGRRFAYELADGELPGAQLLEAGGAPPIELPGDWVLKRELGFAGRGMRRARFPLDQAGRRWLTARWEEDGLVLLEPWVQRERDFAWHGWVARTGDVHLGQLTVQECDATGRWRVTRLAQLGELDGVVREALEAAARRAARGLAGAGYHGPFGVDGYQWRDSQGRLHLRALGEVNARFSMGWAIGTGDAGRSWVLDDP